jgi:acyl carrier protein
MEQWDSLSVLTVIAMVDADYDVRLKAKELKQADTLSELFTVVESKQA